MTTALPAVDAKPQTLDELMLAMDVVDTLRHQDNLVARELDETRREADLIERMRSIYKSQGIEVPDDVIRQGVTAIKEDRFVYVPPKPGLGVSLAKLWILRKRIGKVAGAAMLALGLGAGGWWFGVEQPKRAEATRIEQEIAQVIPRGLTQGHQEALSEAKVEAARIRANQILADGRAALARKDAAGGRKAITDLEALRLSLLQEYTLRIVSRPGEQTAVWRVPRGNTNARNYYALVEAIDANGRALTLPILSEEDSKTVSVAKFGVRISAEVFEAIARDKREDGIVQRNRLGDKKRGELDVTYTMPVMGGFITQW
ncbi:MAG: DUF6384 family protein [Beijerinckiaceae bacterium]